MVLLYIVELSVGNVEFYFMNMGNFSAFRRHSFILQLKHLHIVKKALTSYYQVNDVNTVLNN